MRKSVFAAMCVLVVLAATSSIAQQTGVRLVPPPRPGATFIESWRPVNVAGETKIVGTVIDVNRQPVALASVQLRNLVTGTVAQETLSNESGEYVFVVSEPSTYVVEMVLSNGAVAGLSNAGSLARYETLQTVIQLPGRWNASTRSMSLPYHPGAFLGMSAQTTMTAATLSLAVDQNIAPVDAGEPVSPDKP